MQKTSGSIVAIKPLLEMEKFEKYWNYRGLLSSLKSLNSHLKRMHKNLLVDDVLWDGKLTHRKKVSEQMNKYYPDYEGKIGGNIPNYNPETQYLVFTSTGWAVADKPSFDEEE